YSGNTAGLAGRLYDPIAAERCGNRLPDLSIGPFTSVILGRRSNKSRTVLSVSFTARQILSRVGGRTSHFRRSRLVQPSWRKLSEWPIRESKPRTPAAWRY